MRAESYKKFLNRTMNVLTEEGVDQDGWAGGRLANYLKVRFPSSCSSGGISTVVKMISYDEDDLIGEEVRLADKQKGS